MKRVFIILFNFNCIFLMAQVPQDVLTSSDTVLINEICIEQVCFGDSIKKIIEYFGKPDTVTVYSPSNEGEFAEPPHTSYWYDNTIFYEIHSGMTDSLFYGCRVEINNTVIAIRGVKMVIGKTVIEEMEDAFPASVAQMKGSHHDKYIHIYITFPSSLKPVAEGLIFEIVLQFTDQILKNVETSFYLN